jgi:hypothetical protein
MKTNAWLLGLLLAASCGQGNHQKKMTDTTVTAGQPADTTAAAAVPQANDSITAQLHAQDTVFEDGSRPASWYNAGFNNPVAFKQFLVRFKSWVSSNETDSIAAHVRFPLKNAANITAFKKHYPQLFSSKVKNSIAAQRLDRIFRNSQGAMIGNGAVWFTEDQNNYLLIAVNPD